MLYKFISGLQAKQTYKYKNIKKLYKCKATISYNKKNNVYISNFTLFQYIFNIINATYCIHSKLPPEGE